VLLFDAADWLLLFRGIAELVVPIIGGVLPASPLELRP
jgi:hypothetical protein